MKQTQVLSLKRLLNSAVSVWFSKCNVILAEYLELVIQVWHL